MATEKDGHSKGFAFVEFDDEVGGMITVDITSHFCSEISASRSGS
jgi:hypothetical protein